MKIGRWPISLLFVILLTPALPVGIANPDIDNAHSIATNKMILSQNREPPTNGTSNASLYVPIVFVAGEGDKLVIGIDVRELAYGANYTEQDVRDYLGVDVPLEIMYMSFPKTPGFTPVEFIPDIPRHDHMNTVIMLGAGGVLGTIMAGPIGTFIGGFVGGIVGYAIDHRN